MGKRNKGTFVTLFEGVFLSFQAALISLNNCLCSVIHFSLVLPVFSDLAIPFYYLYIIFGL